MLRLGQERGQLEQRNKQGICVPLLPVPAGKEISADHFQAYPRDLLVPNQFRHLKRSFNH